MGKIALSLCLLLLASPLVAADFPTTIGTDSSGKQLPTVSAYSVTNSHDTIFAGAIGPAKQWPSWQRWEKDFLIVMEASASPVRPAVMVYDRDGNIVREAVVWFPDAKEVGVADATLNDAGMLIVSAGVIYSGDDSVKNLIVAFDASGKMTQVLLTLPFVPLRICSVGKDSIWAYGWDRRYSPKSNYPMLREFSFEGGERNLLLDRGSLSKDFLTGGRWHDDVGMRCNDNTVALYLGSAGELIEHDVHKPDSLVRWKLPAMPKDMRVTGFALTGEGEFFASIKDEGERDSVTYGIFHLEKSAGSSTRWVRIGNSLLKRTRREYAEVAIMGVDGDAVVYVSDIMKGLVGWSEIGSGATSQKP